MVNRKTSRKADSALFHDADGNMLFVPTLGMWQYRKAASPVQILFRLGEPPELWYEWNKQFAEMPVVLQWLRNLESLPATVKPVYPETVRKLTRDPREGEIFFSPEMMKFRRASSLNALAKQLRGKDTINPSYWVNKVYSDLDWFRAWLHGDPAPPHVAVATEGDISKCRAAWDYGSHGKAVTNRGEQSHSYSLYCGWLRRFFPRENLLEWVDWLYGGPSPSSWYVVPERLVRLHKRLSVPAISAAAGLNVEQVFGWRKHRRLSAVLNDAITKARAAGGGGLRNGTAKPRSEAWHWIVNQSENHRLALSRHQYASTINDILRFATAASIPNACADVGMARNTWNGYQMECRRIAGDNACKQLVEFVEGGRQAGNEPAGVIAPRLFIPPPSMRRFRELARQIASAQTIPGVKRKFSPDCFRQWFLYEVVPHKILSELAQRSADDRTVAAQNTTANNPLSAGSHIDTLTVNRLVVNEGDKPKRKRTRKRAAAKKEQPRQTPVVEAGQTAEPTAEVRSTNQPAPDHWFDSPPPADSRFQHGPVTATLKELVIAFSTDFRTLRRQNGKVHWIRRVNRTTYDAWFDTEQKLNRASEVPISN